MRTITGKTFDEERALYGSKELEVAGCRFEGPADGESAFKESNCRMVDCDLAFEKSDVEAEIASYVVSIKNPRSGEIKAKAVGEIIMDDPEACGRVSITEPSH